jgi:dTDP-4-amino-4,6-dideoxygalactose transaminase
MTIPIANPIISEQAKEEVAEVLDSGMLADGEVVRVFEDEFAEYVGVEHAIATSSGTTALHAMLEASGVGEGDKVLTTPFSFISTANSIVHAGAEPVFADIDPRTYNLDPDEARSVLDKHDNVEAIMPVHLYGLPADMDEFREIAHEHDLLLFEDAAQAHGAEYDGEKVGSVGDAGAFSFYPTKNMTTGEGGMITTDDDEIAERARQVVDHGRTEGYEHTFVGYNYRMTNIAAAIGRDQLNRLPDWVERRRENARLLNDDLGGEVETPHEPDGAKHAYHQYTVRTDDRERLKRRLENDEVGYGVYYPVPIPDQPAYDDLGNYPEAEKASDEVLSLPVHPCVSEDDIRQIVEAVRRTDPHD